MKSNYFSKEGVFEKGKHPLGGYALLALVTLAIHYLLKFKEVSFLGTYEAILMKLTFTLTIIFVIIFVERIVENLILKLDHSKGDKYNLLSISRLLTTAVIIIVIVAFLFQNLYAAAVSFGIISLVLGFALQAPIASFIAWLYIVFRKPYKMGDRIQLKHMRGDVVEINYLDTAILECNGDYLGNDRSSGRVVYFPNSLLLSAELINYSGPIVPFIWNETAVQVAYTSDIKFVEESLIEAAWADFEEQHPKHAQAETNQWQPAVYFRVNQYAWLEAVVSYPVEPSDTTGRRNRILKKALPILNATPDKVQFPEGQKR